MYPPSFEYHRASSVAEALSLLGEHSGAKLLAGGHSLIPLMKLRLADPGALIDIGRIAELRGISAANGSARIGALTTHAEVAGSDALPAGLAQAASMVADVQVRNRGTLGGNVAHADPASDPPTMLLALGATFHMTGPGGERSVAAADFFTGLFETALADGEILTAIEVPAEGADSGSAYAALRNPASNYAMVAAGVAVTVADGACTAASVAVGGLTPHATRAPAVEAALVGKALDEATIAAAAAAVADDLGDDILADIHAGAEYRRKIAPVMIQRALTDAAARAG
ncbi:MAG: FAD binding domain-containing protein [Anaerolineales bacterium]